MTSSQELPVQPRFLELDRRVIVSADTLMTERTEYAAKQRQDALQSRDMTIAR